jgi:dTDP-4-dehydrorhamnose 3,5-epimerase
MTIIPCPISGLVIFEPTVYEDSRGFFMETWNQRRYRDAGLDVSFVQDNISCSSKNVLRGLHYQIPVAQGKLVSVLEGEVFDVAVDMRRSSETFRAWHGVNLSDKNKRQFFIPPGFAHGFVVLSDRALFHYKCTEYYSPGTEVTIRWDEPAIGIEWPCRSPIISKRDLNGLLVSNIPDEKLFS